MKKFIQVYDFELDNCEGSSVCNLIYRNTKISISSIMKIEHLPFDFINDTSDYLSDCDDCKEIYALITLYNNQQFVVDYEAIRYIQGNCEVQSMKKRDLDDLRIKRHVSRLYSAQLKDAFEKNEKGDLADEEKKELSELLEEHAEFLSEKISREERKTKMIVGFVLGGFLVAWLMWVLCKANKRGD